MLKKNVTKEKIKAGQVVVGFRLDFAAPYIVEVLGNVGFDFFYLDLEHAPIDVESCAQMFRAAEIVGLTPLVRLPTNEPGAILRLLDAGAMGVIVSHCGTKEEAESAVKAVKYHPEGERGIAGRSLALSGMAVPDYVKQANKETLVAGMVEDAAAVKNLPKILTVAGLDVLFIGRLDLSLSLGVPGQITTPPVSDIVDKVIADVRAAGKVVGVGAINVEDPASVKKFINQGAQWFTLDAAGLLRSYARNAVKVIRG